MYGSRHRPAFSLVRARLRGAHGPARVTASPTRTLRSRLRGMPCGSRKLDIGAVVAVYRVADNKSRAAHLLQARCDIWVSDQASEPRARSDHGRVRHSPRGDRAGHRRRRDVARIEHLECFQLGRPSRLGPRRQPPDLIESVRAAVLPALRPPAARPRRRRRRRRDAVRVLAPAPSSEAR